MSTRILCRKHFIFCQIILFSFHRYFVGPYRNYMLIMFNYLINIIFEYILSNFHPFERMLLIVGIMLFDFIWFDLILFDSTGLNLVI